MPSSKYAAYEAVRPYFDLVRAALGDLVDGEHFFDIVSDDVATRSSTTSPAGLALSGGVPI
jgi:hypothetical protein